MFLPTVLILCLSYPISIARSVESFYESPQWVLHDDQPQDSSYQVRLYNATNWLTATINAFSEYEAAEVGFDLVYRYTKGNNSRGSEMAMTIPFTLQAYQSECVLCVRKFTLSYFIPQEYQVAPPEPLHPHLRVEWKPKTLVYVRQLNSYQRQSIQFRYEANTLYRHLLNNEVTSIDRQTMLFATYDAPFKTFHSSNQVWLFPDELYYEYEDEPEDEMIEKEDR